MIEVVSATPEHFREIEQPVDPSLFQSVMTEETVLAESSRTLLKDGRPIALFGIWPFWAHVGRAWTVLSEEVLRQNAKSLHRAVTACLDEIEERDEYRRIEAVVRFGHLAGHRWLRHMRFQREGLMRRYGPGDLQDYHLYARIR